MSYRKIDYGALATLFCLHFDKTHDLEDCIRLVVRGSRVGLGRAWVAGLLEQRSAARRSERPVTTLARVHHANGLLWVVDAVAADHGLTVKQLLNRSQTPRLTRARAEAIWLLRVVYSLSYPEIGFLVDRDHSSVMTAFRRMQAIIDAEAGLEQRLRDLVTAAPVLKAA